MKIGFNEYGIKNEKVMVLIHGYPDSSDIWKNYVQNLENHFHIINIEIPSDLNSIFEIKMAIHSILKNHKGKKEIFIMGHDLGCVWATLIADELKNDLSGLILIGGLTLNQFKRRLLRPTQILKSWYMFLFQIPILPKILVDNYSGQLLKIPSLLFQKNFIPNEVGLKNWKQYRLFFKNLLSKNSYNLIDAKTLVIWGSHDAFLITPKASEFRREFSNVEIRILKGDHWVHLEKSDEVIRYILTKFGGKYGHFEARRKEFLQAG